MARPKSPYQPPDITISLHFKTPFAAELTTIAESLGIRRHKLVVTAVHAGLEAAIEQLRAEQLRAEQLRAEQLRAERLRAEQLHAEQTAPQPATVKRRRKKA